jgi:hypothetical protein
MSDSGQFLRCGAFEPRSLVNGPGVRAVLWVQGCGRRCPGCFNPDFLPREGGRTVPVAEVIQWIRAAAAASRERSADFQSAVSRISNPPAPGPADALPTGSRRYSRLETCAPNEEESFAASIPSSTLYPPSSPLEGLSFSGGEPFDQAAALALVAQAVRVMGLGVLIFTGHPWDDLEHSPDADHRALLAAADLLVAGPYERDHPPIHLSNNPPIHSPPPHPLLASANQRLIFLTDRYRTHDFGQQRRVEFRIAPDGTMRVSGFPTIQTSSNPLIQQSTAP